MVDFLEELVNEYNLSLPKLSENEAEKFKNEILSIAKDLGVDISRLFADPTKKSATPPKNDAQKSPTKRVSRVKRTASPKKEKIAPEPKKVVKKASGEKFKFPVIKGWKLFNYSTYHKIYRNLKDENFVIDFYLIGNRWKYDTVINKGRKIDFIENAKSIDIKNKIKELEEYYKKQSSPEPKKVEKKVKPSPEPKKNDVSGIITFSEYEKASKGYGSDKLPKEFKILEYSVMMANRLCQDNKNVLSCNLAFGGLNNPNGPFREGITYAYSKKNRNLSLFRTLKSGALKILNIVKDGGLPVDNFIDMVQSAEYQEPKKVVKKSAPKGKVVDWDIQKRIASEKSSNETVDKFKEILKFQEEQKRKEEEEKNKSRKDELESRKRNAVWLKKDGGYVKIPSGVKGLEYYWSKKYKTFIYVSTNELQSGTEYLKRISDLDAVVEKADEILGEADWSKFYNDLSENKLEPYKRVTMKFKAEVDKIFNSPRQRKTNKKSAPKVQKGKSKIFDKRVGTNNKAMTYENILKKYPDIKEIIGKLSGGAYLSFKDEELLISKLVATISSKLDKQDSELGRVFSHLSEATCIKNFAPKKWLPEVFNAKNKKDLQEFIVANYSCAEDDYWNDYLHSKDLPKGLQHLPVIEKSGLEKNEDFKRDNNSYDNTEFDMYINDNNVYFYHIPSDKIFAKVPRSKPTNEIVKEFKKNIFSGKDWDFWDIPISKMTDMHIKARKDFINAIEGSDQLTLANKPKRNYKKASGLSNKVVNHLKGAKQVATSKKLTFSQKLRKLLEY
jgi:hypothetical protein